MGAHNHAWLAPLYRRRVIYPRGCRMQDGHPTDKGGSGPADSGGAIWAPHPSMCPALWACSQLDGLGTSGGKSVPKWHVKWFGDGEGVVGGQLFKGFGAAVKSLLVYSNPIIFPGAGCLFSERQLDTRGTI